MSDPGLVTVATSLSPVKSGRGMPCEVPSGHDRARRCRECGLEGTRGGREHQTACGGMARVTGALRGSAGSWSQHLLWLAGAGGGELDGRMRFDLGTVSQSVSQGREWKWKTG